MRNKQIIARILKSLIQAQNKVKGLSTHHKILKIYQRIKQRRYLPFRSQRDKLKKYPIKISWKWGLFIMSQIILGFAFYEKLLPGIDPFDQIKQIYPDKIKMLKLKQGGTFQQIPYNSKEKSTKIIYCITPSNEQQLTNIIQFGYAHNYCIVSGRYDKIIKIQKKVMNISMKYILINMDQLNSYSFDYNNQFIKVGVGSKCKYINEILEKEGYQKIFLSQMDELAVHQIINYNLPLKTPSMNNLNTSIINMEMVSAEGNNFRSASNVQHYGNVPNFNSLFIGSQGKYAIPMNVIFKLRKKISYVKEYQYKILSQNINQQCLIIQDIQKRLKRQFGRVEAQVEKIQNQLKIKIKVYDKDIALDNIFYGIKLIPISQHNETQVFSNSIAFFSINSNIFANLFLQPKTQTFSYNLISNILKVKIPIKEQQNLKNITSLIILHGGILIWYDNYQLFLQIKQKQQAIQTGVQLLRKTNQVKESLDHKKILFTIEREQKYFIKSFFRKLSETFW